MPKKSSSSKKPIPKVSHFPDIFLGMIIGAGITLTVLECIRYRIFENIMYFFGFQNKRTPLIRENSNDRERETIHKLFPKVSNDIALTREKADTLYYISAGLIAAGFIFQILKNLLNVSSKKISAPRSSQTISYVDKRKQTDKLAPRNEKKKDTDTLSTFGLIKDIEVNCVAKKRSIAIFRQ